jgi:SOS-response transcriptional repressor LexA
VKLTRSYIRTHRKEYNKVTMDDNGGYQEGVSIHAGFPNPAADKSLQTLDFNQLLIQHGASTFMFRVRGNQWEPAGIFDNDIAVVDRALDPRKTDVVVWWNEAKGEFAISAYTTMPTTGKYWGVVTSTIHQFRRRSHAADQG